MDRTLLLLGLIISGVACQACRTNSTVANMCQTGSVHGPVVTLDVTSGADGNFTSCSCFLQSNSSGFYFDFLSTPESPGCNAGLQLRFDDTSMQLLCGGLPGVQYTRGQSATIIYNMIDSTDAADSSYCLTFYNNDTDIDFQLSCYNPLSSSTPLSSTTLAINSTFTTTPLSNSSFPSSNLTSTQSPITPWSNSTSPTANIASTQSPITRWSNSTFPTANITSTLSPITPWSNSSSASTTFSGSPTTLANMTDHPAQSSTLSVISTSHSSSSPGTPILPSPTTATVTSTAPSTTNYTNNSTAATTEQTPMNTTSSIPVTPAQPSLSTTRQNVTKSVLSSEETTTKSILNTTAPVGSTVEQNNSISSKSSFNSTSSPTTLQVFQNTTLANTTYAPTSYHNSTEDVFQQNTTITPEVTDAPKVTKSVPTNNTSAAGGSSANASMSTGVTVNPNITTTESTNNSSNNTAPSANTTEATFTTTHIPEYSTDVFENSTVTTNSNSTTSSENINTTATTGFTGPTTEKLETTTVGWMPPDGGYSAPAKTNNLLVVLVPVLAVLLLVFLVVVTYVMCKRSRKASKQTKVPGKNTQGKKDMNANLNDKTSEQNNSSTVGIKSDNPADYFVAQQANKPVEKEFYKEIQKDTKTEKEHPNGRVRENHELSMAMKSLDSSLKGNGSGGKPKVYEPTEREKGILESLELSSVVIESDPNDPNRYFKKADPGDWYRVIMKGKKPKDQKSKSGKSKGSRRKSSQTDSSEGDADKTKRHRKKRESNGNEMNMKSRRSSKHRKRNSGYYSDPEQTVTLTQTGKLSKAYEALLQSGDFDNSPRSHTFGSQTLPANYKMDNVNVDKIKQPEPNLTVSKSLVIESKPKVVEPPRTLVIMSQSTSSAKQSTSNTMQDIAQQNSTPSLAIIKSTPVQKKETVTTQVQSSPARPRSNLFGSRSGSLKASEQQSEKAENAVKRPEIVPPLNLTGTGDQVEIDEDGLEGFVLNH